jgi:cyclopropane-fatty-acyl-phospholipid synthase
MNGFDPHAQFDRIVSVEMFEHMMNWRALMTRVKSWLRPDGRFFMHIFTHRTGAYLFDRADREDWIAQHFFTGGVMPSHHLIRQYADLFEVEKEWRWSGTHYQRTALDWLNNFDAQRDQIEDILQPVYGRDTSLWMRLALVFSRNRRPVRHRRRQRMGRQPLQDEGAVVGDRGPLSSPSCPRRRASSIPRGSR